MSNKKHGFKHQNLNMPGISNPINSLKSYSPHWYISFNPSIADYGCKTTALVLGQGEYFLILQGDHRQSFADIIGAEFDPQNPSGRLSKCIDYIREHRKELHKFSDQLI